jgi:hypothetical protein
MAIPADIYANPFMQIYSFVCDEAKRLHAMSEIFEVLGNDPSP